MEIPLCGAHLRVTEEPLHPTRISLARDERAGTVAKTMEPEEPQPSRLGGSLEPAP